MYYVGYERAELELTFFLDGDVCLSVDGRPIELSGADVVKQWDLQAAAGCPEGAFERMADACFSIGCIIVRSSGGIWGRIPASR